MFEVLILEDEDNTRQYLAKIAGETPQVTAVYTASHGDEAIALARRHRPGCVLLDIDLSPGDADGLTVAKSIFSENPDCFLVFITGYAKYALQSFAVHPYDYIVKPVNKARLRTLLAEIAVKAAQPALRADTVVFKKKGELCRVNQDDIFFIEIYRKAAHVHTSTGVLIVHQTLNDIEPLLNRNFWRSHKSYIINLDKVQKVYSGISSRSYSVSFSNYDREAMMSRYKFNQYLEMLGGASPQ